jgi:hypothetical protein
MNGDHYNYYQSYLSRIKESMQEDLDRIGTMNQWGETAYQLEPSTVDAIKLAMALLEVTEKVVHDIDWCLSGDTGEDTLARKMNEHRKDLHELR